MSTDRYITLATIEEEARAKKDKDWDTLWQEHISEATFDFGCADDPIPWEVTDELNNLHLKVDDVVSLLGFLFVQSFDCQQINMFERFLAVNLGQNKSVHFWSK